MTELNHIHYIGYYTSQGNPNDYIVFPSCNGKMDYIVRCLTESGYPLSILSLGESTTMWSLPKRETVDGLFITYVGTIPRAFNGVGRILARLYLLLQLVTYLLTKPKKADKVIVYHSTAIVKAIRMVKRIRPSLDIIYEIEEIYAAAYGHDDSHIRSELMTTLFTTKYIVVNDILAGKINCLAPKAIVVPCYGNFSCNAPLTPLEQTKKDAQVIVYAGIIGLDDSDVYLAIDAMRYLPDTYQLKIVGYGSEFAVNQLRRRIEGVSNVRYDGMLQGKEYSDYLMSCDVGISPRRLPDELSDYTFPSKVLVYFSHGLVTVCSRINCVENSKLGPYITFINDLTPEGVSRAIIEASEKHSDPSLNVRVVSELDHIFKESLADLLK